MTRSHTPGTPEVALSAVLTLSSHQPHFLDLSGPADFPCSPSSPAINTEPPAGPIWARSLSGQIAADKGQATLSFCSLRPEFTFKSENVCLRKRKCACVCWGAVGGRGKRKGAGPESKLGHTRGRMDGDGWRRMRGAQHGPLQPLLPLSCPGPKLWLIPKGGECTALG